MPTLRDLSGNIVTTICMCLIVSQSADMIRLLTVFKSHISLLIAGNLISKLSDVCLLIIYYFFKKQFVIIVCWLHFSG